MDKYTFEPNEKIMKSYQIKKYRDQDDLAEVKDIVITSKNLFNLESNANDLIKRKIPLNKIYAVSFSLASNEFIVHVDQEYDYR